MTEQLKLVVKGLASTLEEYPLGPDSLSIGRDPECDICLPNPFISRRHATLTARDGRHLIRSQGLNSLTLNQRPLRGGEEHPLEADDVISLPGFTLTAVDGRASYRRRLLSLDNMHRYSDLKARIHKALFERVDLQALTGEDLEEEERRRLLKTALDDLLRYEIPIEQDMMEVILAESLHGALVEVLFIDGEERRRDGWDTSANDRAFERIVRRFADRLGVLDSSRSEREKREILEERFEAIFQAERSSIPDGLRRELVRRSLRRDLEDLIFGLGPLEDLLRIPDLNEIMVVGRDRIFVERQGGQIQETGRTFPADDNLEVVIGRIVGPVGRYVNRAHPTVDARLEDGSRVNIVIPPVSIQGPAITIRKFRSEAFTMEELASDRYRTLNSPAVKFLTGCVRARKNLIVSGGTGSGKTALLNTLGSLIPAEERLVVIEDAAELRLPQHNLITLEAKKANVEGEGEITIRDLVRNALRMRPDRIIVGECRGAEALDMLQAMNTGHDGSLTTAHANSPRELVSRLEVMVLEAASGLPVAAIDRQIAGALNVIVQIARQRDRTRRVVAISEVVGYDAEEARILVEDIFHLNRIPPSAGSPGSEEAELELRFTGYLPSFIDDLVVAGEMGIQELFQ